jgi:prepilin-type processing-associated H-X9-DG protein
VKLGATIYGHDSLFSGQDGSLQSDETDPAMQCTSQAGCPHGVGGNVLFGDGSVRFMVCNGVYVFTRDVGAPAEYVPGAVVSVQGAVTEFDLGSGGNPPTGDTLTQIVEPIHALVSAPAGVPVPATVAADVVSDIGAAGESYEGVLVQVENLKVTNINAGGGKVELTDNSGNRLIMDDDAFDWPDQVLNTCYATVTGIMSVQINDDVRTINPRALTDFLAGTGCN